MYVCICGVCDVRACSRGAAMDPSTSSPRDALMPWASLPIRPSRSANNTYNIQETRETRGRDKGMDRVSHVHA